MPARDRKDIVLEVHTVYANGDGEIRTLDPLLARQVLSQLSYTPTDAGLPFQASLPYSFLFLFCFPSREWALVGLSPFPHGYG